MRWIMIIMALAIFSCKATNKGKALKLDRGKFYSTLMAVHKLEGKFNYKQFRVDSLNQEEQSIYDSLFESQGVQENDFLEDYKTYLAFHPEELDSIYEQLIDQLEVEKDSISKAEAIRKDDQEGADPLNLSNRQTLNNENLVKEKSRIGSKEQRQKGQKTNQ